MLRIRDLSPRRTNVLAHVKRAQTINNKESKNVVPVRVSSALSQRERETLGDALSLRERGAVVDAMEETLLRADPYVTRDGRIGANRRNGGAAAELAFGGKSLAGVCAHVKGSGGASIKDRPVLLVSGDGSARRQRRHCGKRSLVRRYEYPIGRRGPKDGVCIGRVRNLASILTRCCSVVLCPRGTTVRGKGGLEEAVGAGVSDTNDTGGFVARIVDVYRRGVARVHEFRFGGCSQACMREAADISQRTEHQRARGRRKQSLNAGLFDAVRHDAERDVVDGIPFQQIVAAKDGETGAVEPVIGVEGINLQGLDHPADSFIVDILGNRDPWRNSICQAKIVVDIGVVCPVPDLGPGRTAIVAAEYDCVGIPAVQAGRHDRSWLLEVDGQTPVAVVETASGIDRAYIPPSLGRNVISIYCAKTSIVGSTAVAIRHVECLFCGRKLAFVGEKSSRLTSDGFPRATRIFRHVY